MELRWALRARGDLRRIYDHYSRISPALADEIIAEVERAPDILMDHPFAGPPLPHRTLRKWSVRDVPFVLLYRVLRSRVEIVRVVHAASDWQPE